ncbi:SDR family oxidoreductase [Microbaculum marinisediminis]|uniref:SDR family oxidoreductase n=1 Tax=Microbaculum marinisediminis TaxID=2931392 RepID=A0AAW5QY55_9HYPH|nr:SDR family oxidoreductase [Microbaculum sp. A6E488]MCT8972489.1 SDR family oxidoreductase [Microbaculum sp. A6E488]
MDLGIAGKRAIVCASSRGLGRACAEALAEAGCEVVINGVDRDRLERVAGEIAQATGAKVVPVAGDVSLPETQAALLAACADPDILVNNNGGPPLKDFRELDREAMLKGTVMNMVTPIELIQKVIDPMAERGFGRIVNITSSSVLAPIPGLDLSSGARAGLTAFVSGVARKVADRGVTINNLLPGMFDTDRLRATHGPRATAAGKTVDEIAAQRMATIPAGRFGDPAEFGQTCAFLCSVHAGYMTGRNILLDGGFFDGTW